LETLFTNLGSQHPHLKQDRSFQQSEQRFSLIEKQKECSVSNAPFWTISSAFKNGLNYCQSRQCSWQQ